MVKLYIDTRDSRKTIIRLQKKGQEFEEILEEDKPRADTSLELIDKILKKSKTQKNEITHIIVARGPGSYTGVRIGVSIANALSFSLGIPVNEKIIGELEEPTY